METLNEYRGARVRRPVVRLFIDDREVTADLSAYLLSATYTDHVEGVSDTLDIRLDDADGRFRGPWYPSKGDTLSFRFGYAEEALADGGRFDIDEIAGEGPPDVMTIRGVAAGVKRPLRTHRGRAFENTTLRAIAARVAGKLRLELVGEIARIPIRRVTQIHEHDLTFLRRLAGKYGHAFNIKGDKMVFFQRDALRAAEPVLVIGRADLTRYRVRDKIMDVVAGASVAYFDPKTKTRITRDARDAARGEVSGDRLKLNTRAESPEQAEAQAKAALSEANIDAAQLEMTTEGEPRLVAGINFSLVDMGGFSGAWFVVRSRHVIEKSGGYHTEVEAKRVRTNE
uniref:Phage protein D n=1 Tax=Candidatus Kentrum sp. LPFa TaxID=2126335 RepID=A0A450WK66_9GAMM|nr:MAG: hypothetical protein BECKLPF1236B_GA0070989_11176 [Candidatus Kentron sp. LPFa]